jgi:hypothetical protein
MSSLHPRTALTTALLYLGNAVAAIPAFLVIRPMLFDPENPASTLAHIVENEALARLGIGLELALVVTQALVALWFYKLFRGVDAFAAGSLAAFGMVNTVVILASAASLGAALDAALAPPFADAAGGAQLMYLLSGSLWDVATLFFGLWLIPMGVLALRSGMPRALGWILVAGGVGYDVSGFVAYLAPAASPAAALLPYLATIGEFWMIGWLLWHAFRARRVPGTRALDSGSAARSSEGLAARAGAQS